MFGKRLTAAAGAILILAVLATACGGGGGGAAPAALNITIKAQDIKFDVTTITAQVGQTVNITYVNEGALEHTFFIDGLVTRQTVQPGETANFSFTPASTGTFEYVCDVAGHREAGMVGTLIVNP